LILTAVNLSVSKEKRRLEANQAALLADVERWRTEAGKSAASVERLVLSESELKKSNSGLAEEIKKLNVKLKRVEAAAQTAVENKVEVKTVIRDSVVLRDSVIVKVKDFRWSDPWTDIRGSIDRDGVDLSVRSRDTLVQVVHRVPGRFLFFRCGTKAVRQTVMSTNPHTSVVYTEYIEMKK
jgi:hypothetical protein